MSICIAYRGKLSDPALIPELVKDLAAKAKEAGWRHKTMSELIAAGTVPCPGLEGITVYPHPECEALSFHFDEEGTFINAMYWAMMRDDSRAKRMREAMAASADFTRIVTSAPQKKAKRGNPSTKNKESGPSIRVVEMPALTPDFLEEGSRYNWTKTQFAGPQVHQAVCALLRYIQEKYAPGLKVYDDSGYFDHGDEEKLMAQFAYVDRIMSLTKQAFQAAAASSDAPESFESFLDKVQEELDDAQNKLH